MNKSKERNNRFRSRFKDKTYELKRIEAITPETLNNKTVKLPEHCKSLSKAELSCSLSHLKAIHTAYHEQLDYVLIMEDDIYFINEPNWEELIKSAPEDWNVLQLFTLNAYVYEDLYNNKLKWREHKNMVSAGAYLINRNGMEKLLKRFMPDYKNKNWNEISIINFEKMFTECTADFFIYFYAKTYVYSEILFNAEGIDSEIHSDHLPYHIDSINRINDILNNKN